MKEYIFSILGASLIASVVTLFLPEGKEISKYVKLLVSLAVICAIINPFDGFGGESDFSNFFSSFLEGSENDLGAEEKYYGVLTDIGERELEVRISELVSENFSIGEGELDVSVEAHEENGGFAIDRVVIGLSGMAIFKDPYDIEEYVESLVGCDCDTYY